MSTPVQEIIPPLSTRSRAITPAPLPMVVWTLVGVGNAQAANPLTVIHPTPFTIGRKPGCTLQLNSKTISSHHADLHIREGQLILVDRGSTNGTYVNGQRTTPADGRSRR
ncbi:MAG: FHA domain-containing protein [Pirellulales bacterium]